MEKILAKKALSEWIGKLKEYTVYSPMEKEDLWSYEAVTDAKKVSLDFPNLIQSPKKVILPQKEVFFRFSTSAEGKPVLEEVQPEKESVLVLGVRPCDAKALTLTDKVFGGDYQDLYYLNRREQTIIAGLACNTPPSENCFCTSVAGSPSSKEGMDLLITETGDDFFMEALTKKGEEIIKLAGGLVKDSTQADKDKVKALHQDAEKKIKRKLENAGGMAEKLQKIFEAPLWDEESMSCIRCGICTYLCPACHCFDINDELESSLPVIGKRVRTWDTCQFPDFTMHSSGHNPRPDKAARLRQRINHKFNYFPVKYQNYQCTGCGRCISKCPVGIDIIEVLDKVREYE